MDFLSLTDKVFADFYVGIFSCLHRLVFTNADVVLAVDSLMVIFLDCGERGFANR